MNVLSLFDGMRCGRIALERAGIAVDSYYASEIDKHAIKVGDANYPDAINLGDANIWREWDIDWRSISLLIAGSPCQGFSFAGKQLAFDDPRSAMFFVYADILHHIRSVNPDVKFFLENVRMKKEHLNIITEYLGVEPAFINSSLASAQNRQRYYWANWDFNEPEDRGIVLADVLEPDLPSCGVGARIVGRKLNEQGKRDDYNKDIKISQYLECRKDQKAGCMTTVYKDSVVPYFKTDKRLKIKFNQSKASCLTGGANSGGNHSDVDILVIDPDVCRRYSITECERLQTVPDGYTQNKGVSNRQCYKMLGNGWTVDVIAHIFKGMNSTPMSGE